MGATVSIRVHGSCHCEYQGTCIMPLSIRVHGSCHCEYQGTGISVTVSIRVQGWVSL